MGITQDKENQTKEKKSLLVKKSPDTVFKGLFVILERFKNDLNSYLDFLQNFFINLKEKYNMTSFDDQQLFNSLYQSQAIPYSVKQEMALVMRQLNALLPIIEKDFEFILKTVLNLYN